MAGTILYTGGVEKLAPHAFRMSGDRRDFLKAEADHPWPGFPMLFIPPERQRQAYIDMMLPGWPCWFQGYCGVVYNIPLRVAGMDSELLPGFLWAMQIAELIGVPIDYAQARDRYMAKMLRLRAELAPDVPALRIAKLLEAKLRGERYGYQLALQMLNAYRMLLETDAEDETTGQIDWIDWTEDDWTEAYTEAYLEWESWSALAFYWVDSLFWSICESPDDSSMITRTRQFLLDAMNESRVEGPGEAFVSGPDCEGGRCEACFEEFWLELQADMTESEQADIARLRAELGMIFQMRVEMEYEDSIDTDDVIRRFNGE